MDMNLEAPVPERRTHNMKSFRNSRLAPALFFLLIVILQTHSAFAEKWSFSVFSDNRGFYEAYRNVLEEIKSNKPADPDFPPAEFVVGVGDLDPLHWNFEIFKEIIGPSVPFIPVRGNHEATDDLQFILKRILPSEKAPVSLYDNSSVTYFFDWKNVRFISIDNYAAYARGMDKPALLEWLEKAISSAREADHVFVSFHEPHLPDNSTTDPLWSLLLKHSDKVRAVLWGHTHSYGRRLIPGTSHGVYIINAGNAGNIKHSDDKQTIVQISVDKGVVNFRAIQAPNLSKDFKVSDQWKATAARD
jgi:hypothetical protein